MAVTLGTYAPFNTGAGSNTYEDGWRAMMRRTGNPGVIRDAMNGFSVFGDSTGMQVKVNTGELWGEGHWGQNPGPGVVVLPVTANATGWIRRDLVIYRIRYDLDRIELDVLAGPSGVGIAGGAEPATWMPSTRVSRKDWRALFAANLETAFFMSQAVAAEIRRNRSTGSIVSISSISGMNTAPFHIAYGTAKAAIVAMTRTMAVELAADYRRSAQRK